MPSYWMSHTSAEKFPHNKQNINCDVAIIGGGLTGLSIAFHLKSYFKSWSVVVVEAAQIGFGASGKSGGIIVEHPSIPGSESDVRYLKDFLSSQGIHCEWQTHPKEPHQHLLNPYLLTANIASLCHSIGVHIYEHSEVKRIDSEKRQVIGDAFCISANLLFIATDAAISFLDSLVKEVYINVQNCIVVRVTNTTSKNLPWGYFSETQGEKYVWGRKIRSNVFLYGNEEKNFDRSISSSSKATQDILASLKNELPFLEYCEVLGKWSGLISRFSNGCRRITQIDRTGKCYYIGGYNGYGIAAAVRSGCIVRSVVQGYEAPLDFPLKLRFDMEKPIN